MAVIGPSAMGFRGKVGIFRIISAFTAFLALSLPVQADWNLDLLYGDSANFWSVIDQLENGDPSFKQSSPLLDDLFEEPAEGLATSSFAYRGPTHNFLAPLFPEGYLGVGADYLVGGSARNRFLPEISAYQIYSGHIDFGFLHHPGGRALSIQEGWIAQLGSTLGAGQWNRIDALAIEFYPKAPIQKTGVFYLGGDLSLGYQTRVHPNLSQRSQAGLEPTWFTLDSTHAADSYDLQKDQWVWRWRFENEWNLEPLPHNMPGFGLGLMAITGQQPIPKQFLPRTWDAVHEVQADPAVGQLLGLGAALIFDSGSDAPSGRIDGGFFGGYWGAGASVHINAFFIGAGTWGLEQSSGYRIRESRIRFLQAGISHEI